MPDLKLLPDLEERLEALARRTGRDAAAHAREAIEMHLEEMEDALLAGERLERGGVRILLEELERELDEASGW